MCSKKGSSAGSCMSAQQTHRLFVTDCLTYRRGICAKRLCPCRLSPRLIKSKHIFNLLKKLLDEAFLFGAVSFAVAHGREVAYRSMLRYRWPGGAAALWILRRLHTQTHTYMHIHIYAHIYLLSMLYSRWSRITDGPPISAQSASLEWSECRRSSQQWWQLSGHPSWGRKKTQPVLIPPSKRCCFRPLRVQLDLFCIHTNYFTNNN